MNLPNSTVDDRIHESLLRPKQVDLNDIAAKIDELRSEIRDTTQVQSKVIIARPEKENTKFSQDTLSHKAHRYTTVCNLIEAIWEKREAKDYYNVDLTDLPPGYLRTSTAHRKLHRRTLRRRLNISREIPRKS